MFSVMEYMLHVKEYLKAVSYDCHYEHVLLYKTIPTFFLIIVCFCPLFPESDVCSI